jgi:hypothetical protein
MYFELYDSVSGDTIGRTLNLNFGDIIQNHHCVRPVVFRAFSDIENSVSDLKVYLEDKGTIEAEFGYYTSPSFEPLIGSGSTKLSSHFVEVPDASSTSPNGVFIGWDTTSSDWVWFDTQTPLKSGLSEPNFRFFYDWT